MSEKEAFKSDEINLGQMTRGEKPVDIRIKCLQLCKDYLADNWLQQTADTITGKRLSGGLTNQLYYCSIAKPSATAEAPQEVAIRLYGQKYFNKSENEGNERLTDIIVALMVSENKMGPKIYGLFDGGQILGYYRHRQFRAVEQKDPKLIGEVFRKLAQLHAMKVPVKVNTNWIFNDFDEFYDIGFRKFRINEMIDELNLKTFKTHDLKQEIEWLKTQIVKCQSPSVFCHHDFRASNIMVCEPNDGIIFCDLEYAGYGFRGYDWGTLMAEWGRDVTEFGKSEKLIQKYPNDEQIKSLIQLYLDESGRLLGQKYLDNKVNSIEHILKEAKLFSLVATMWLILFCVKNDDNSEGLPVDKKVLMQQWGESSYEGYWYLKDMFTKQKVFD